MNPAFGPSIAIFTAPEPMYHGSLASTAALPWSKFINTPDGDISWSSQPIDALYRDWTPCDRVKITHMCQ